MNSETQQPLFDREFSLCRLAGNRILLADIISIFSDDYPLLLAEIKQSIENSDANQLKKSAHAIKGLVSNFGENECLAFAKQLEAIGDGQRLEQARELVGQFEFLLARLSKELIDFANSDIRTGQSQIPDC